MIQVSAVALTWGRRSLQAAGPKRSLETMVAHRLREPVEGPPDIPGVGVGAELLPVVLEELPPGHEGPRVEVTRVDHEIERVVLLARGHVSPPVQI